MSGCNQTYTRHQIIEAECPETRNSEQKAGSGPVFRMIPPGMYLTGIE